MAVINSATTCIEKCNKLIITDTSDWDTITPGDDIVTTTISVEYDGIVTTINNVGYSETIEIEPSDIAQSTKLLDGIYRITILYADLDTTYTTYLPILNTCNIECTIDKMVLASVEACCQDCGKEQRDKALDAQIDLTALCYAMACGNYAQVEKILSYLNDKLINYNCNNC